MIANYQKKISGPLLDRIDMVVPVARVEREKLFANDPKTARETDWKKQIDRAREIQTARQKQPNSSLPNKQLEKFAKLDAATNSLLATAAEKLRLSARGYFKILRVARTIADLANRKNIAREDIAEALQYRQDS
jgi:magnesium chelatase family protein